MDQLAKLVSGRLKAQPAHGPHPASELLAAFAENALPEADRGHVLQHLGACSDCREILYLALPETPEAQKVLVLQPRPFRRWGWSWGALVAVVAIGAIVSTNRLGHKNQTATMVAPARAKASAAARPMPLPAPVMTAILPANSAIGFSLMVQDGGALCVAEALDVESLHGIGRRRNLNLPC